MGRPGRRWYVATLPPADYDQAAGSEDGDNGTTDTNDAQDGQEGHVVVFGGVPTRVCYCKNCKLHGEKKYLKLYFYVNN